MPDNRPNNGCHSCGSKNPESSRETGFRIECGMTSHQLKSTQGAFTVIELLVVIAVIALLMALLIPVLRSAREQGRRQSCGSQIRQHCMALLMYADDYAGRLPLPDYWGRGLWNLDVDVVNFMLEAGMTKKMFYCPSNRRMHPNMDEFWTLSEEKLPGINYILSGYCYILQVAPSWEGERREIQNNLNGSKIWLKTNTEKQPALRELTVDVTLCNWNERSQEYPNGNFGRVGCWEHVNLGPDINRSIITLDNRTSHLKSDAQPSGMNIGFLDGHVEWRRFNPQWESSEYEQADDIPKPRYGGSRKFWW